MLDDALALRAAWTTKLAALHIDEAPTIVMAGGAAEVTSETFPLPVADAVDGLVTLGQSAPPLDDGATPFATGLPDGSVSACVLLDMWSSIADMDAAVVEARRITESGGRVWLGDVDVDTLVLGEPATQRSAAFYRSRGVAPAGSPGVSTTAMALLRARLREIETFQVVLPVAAFSDAVSYVAAVLSGMWLGVGNLSVAEKAQLETDLLVGLRNEEFPLVEYRPWVLSRARTR